MTHDTPASISTIAEHEGRTVTLRGWLHNRRSSGKIHFLMVRDGSGFIQAVMSKAAVGEEVFAAAGHLSQETAVTVDGTVRADARAPGGYELDVIQQLLPRGAQLAVDGHGWHHPRRTCLDPVRRLDRRV